MVETCILSLIRKDVYILEVFLLTCILEGSKLVHAEKGLDLITCTGTRFDSYDKITSVTQDAWYKGQSVSYKDGAVWLNPDPREVQTRASSNIGKITYKERVQFKYENSGVVSFSTSFTFQIFTTSPYPYCGSGMTFFIADHDKAPERSYGRYLGLVSPNRTNSYKFFAVEFDTHVSEEFEDPSASHIGIDINSLKSIKHLDSQSNSSSPQLYLYNNSTFTTWIQYDAPKCLIQVWMQNSESLPRPDSPSLTLIYNLSDVFQDTMYVGFSASNNASEDSMEGHVLYSWNFTLYPPPSTKSRFFKLLLPIIVALSSLFIFPACFCSLYHIVKARRQRKCKPMNIAVSSSHGGLGPVTDVLRNYTYAELKSACRNFDDQRNKIGEGSFSKVYKATLSNGETVAIKRLKEGLRKEKEFFKEIEIISKLRHRNLLPLLGWCYEEGEALLVYPYMRKGSLNHYLYGKHTGTLSSNVRLNILVGVASALEYLHQNLRDRVLHRDVKAANVLLTEELEPILGDFGLACLISHGDNSITMSHVAGTPGYVAPEVVFTYKATDKSDVYSFGILALVVASGYPALLRSASNLPTSSEVQLVDSVWMRYQSNQLTEALDLTMRMDMPASEKEKWGCVLHVALMCANPCPELRPTMRQVCQALQGDNLQGFNPLPAPIRPTYLSTSPNWPSASESSFCKSGWSLTVSPSDGDGLSIPSLGQASLGTPSTISFGHHSENRVGR